eukprot:COSAG06_NODE_10941_length_1593_cov_1.087684_2_plen_179_part_00
MDLVSSDNSALTKLYLRYRTGSSLLALRPAVALMLDGLVLHGTWRNGPAAAPIDGRMALVTSDEQDEMHLYYRIDDHNLEDGGKLWYRVPNSTSLRHIQTNFLHAGGSGRLKYATFLCLSNEFLFTCFSFSCFFFFGVSIQRRDDTCSTLSLIVLCFSFGMPTADQVPAGGLGSRWAA